MLVTRAQHQAQALAQQLPQAPQPAPLPVHPAHQPFAMATAPRINFPNPPKLHEEMPYVEWIPRVRQMAVALGWDDMINIPGAD